MRAIAGKLGRSQSSLSRELAHNQSSEGIYLPDSAQQGWSRDVSSRKQRLVASRNAV
jgi:IS30 family transposase